MVEEEEAGKEGEEKEEGEEEKWCLSTSGGGPQVCTSIGLL